MDIHIRATYLKSFCPNFFFRKRLAQKYPTYLQFGHMSKRQDLLLQSSPSRLVGIPSTTILVGILFPLGLWERFATNKVGILFLQRLLLQICNKPSGNFVPTRLVGILLTTIVNLAEYQHAISALYTLYDYADSECPFEYFSRWCIISGLISTLLQQLINKDAVIFIGGLSKIKCSQQEYIIGYLIYLLKKSAEKS